ncbi:PadR family transcriptional regulator [Pseudonocardia sp. RS11V-5]|uniref:PadR family transcriptional regulator n=1 Tax=Pseudonocardia terrae TaxID=2905831 RepID=UPI001E348D65|nr:PadR family transcriptional regulator [Pseudonocardia terrae]MCE3553684.1 PadR family transcriptional regulator [Pseudonocardia terrae]
MNRPTRDLSSAFGAPAAALRPARRRRRPAGRRTGAPAEDAAVDDPEDDADDDAEDDIDEATGDADTERADREVADTDRADTDHADTGARTDDADHEAGDEDAGTTDAPDPDPRSEPISPDDRTERRSRARPRADDDRGDRRTTTSRGRSGSPAPQRADAARRTRRYGEVRLRDTRQLDLLILAIAEERPENGRVVHDLLRERSDGVFRPSLQTTYRRLHRLKNDRLITLGPDRRHYSLTPLGRRILTSRRREWAAFIHGLDRVLGHPDADTPRR